MMLYLFLTLTFFVAHSVDVWTPLVNEDGEVYEGEVNGAELSTWHGVQQFGGSSGYYFSDDCQSQGGLKTMKMQCDKYVRSIQLQCDKGNRYSYWRWSGYGYTRSWRYGSAWKSKRGYGSGKAVEIPATGIIKVEIMADYRVDQIKFYTGKSTAFQCGQRTATGKTYSVSAPRGMQLCALRGRARYSVYKLGAGWCYGKTKAPTRRPWWWRRNRSYLTTRSPNRRSNDRYNYYNRWRYRYLKATTTKSPYSNRNRYVYRNTRRATSRPYWRNPYWWRNRYSYNRRVAVTTTKSPNRNSNSNSNSNRNSNSRSLYNYYATSVMMDDEQLENIDIQNQEDMVDNAAQNEDEFMDNEDEEQQTTTSTSSSSTPVFGVVGTLMTVGGFLGIAFVYFTKRDDDDVTYEQIPDHDDEP